MIKNKEIITTRNYVTDCREMIHISWELYLFAFHLTSPSVYNLGDEIMQFYLGKIEKLLIWSSTLYIRFKNTIDWLPSNVVDHDELKSKFYKMSNAQNEITNKEIVIANTNQNIDTFEKLCNKIKHSSKVSFHKDKKIFSIEGESNGKNWNIDLDILAFAKSLNEFSDFSDMKG